MKDELQPKYLFSFRNGRIRLEVADALMLVFQIAFIVLFAIFADYPSGSSILPLKAESGILNDYGAYRDIAIMVYIGFGYLMTFLKHNGYASVGGTLMVSVFALQWALLVNGFFLSALTKLKVVKVILDVRALINGLFSVVSVLISYGVVIGKVSLYEMAFASIFEIVFIGINNYIGNGRGTLLQVMDIGGSIYIHLFGAYFGLAFAWALRGLHVHRSASGSKVQLSGHHLNTSTPQSDLFAMIGTVFLFIYWPSFNGAFAAIQNFDNGAAQMRAIINTVIAQLAGAFTAFVFSRIFRNDGQAKRAKFNMTDIQNATLAAGVAVGASADQFVWPAGAMGIGIAAAFVSVLGYVFVQGWLERRFGLHDTCGVNNLHGMPGLLGGIVSVIVMARASLYENLYGMPIKQWFPFGQRQFAYQLAGIGVTLGLSLFGGLFTALCVRACRSVLNPITLSEAYFSDETEWHVPGEQVPLMKDEPKPKEASKPKEAQVKQEPVIRNTAEL